ncbi:MAG: hypothetical protein D6E12_02040 [Desulfovibrio sp.]|nr:MAG: hypothetical protein D6E12_02040 [Desulfovibrio sp.]
MQGGYVKLWRKSLTSAVWDDSEMWKFWCYCLMKASFSQRKVLSGSQAVELQPGQFSATLAAMSRETGLGVKRIRGLIRLAVELEMILVDQINKRTRIGIINWEHYQAEDESQSLGSGQPDQQEALPLLGAVNEPAPQARPGTNSSDAPQSTSSTKTRTLRAHRNYPDDFECFWKAYPNKVAKIGAFKSWENMALLRPPLETLLLALENHKRSRAWQRGFIPNPRTWLDQGRWEDTVDTNEDPLEAIHAMRLTEDT